MMKAGIPLVPISAQDLINLVMETVQYAERLSRVFTIT